MYIIPCHPPKPRKTWPRMLGGANANLSVDAKLREILGDWEGNLRRGRRLFSMASASVFWVAVHRQLHMKHSMFFSEPRNSGM